MALKVRILNETREMLNFLTYVILIIVIAAAFLAFLFPRLPRNYSAKYCRQCYDRSYADGTSKKIIIVLFFASEDNAKYEIIPRDLIYAVRVYLYKTRENPTFQNILLGHPNIDAIIECKTSFKVSFVHLHSAIKSNSKL